jgi:hypothetical protein
LRLREQPDPFKDSLCSARRARRHHRCLSDIEDRGRRLNQCLLGPGVDCESPHPCERVALYDNNPVAGVHVLLENFIACDVADTESETSISQLDGPHTIQRSDRHCPERRRCPNKNIRFHLGQ